MADLVPRAAARIVRDLWILAEGRRRARIIRNIEHFLPGRTDYEDIYRDHVGHIANYLVEEIHLRWMSPQRILKGCEVTNLELIENHIGAGHRLLLTAAHQGNLDWTWLALCLRFPRSNLAMVGRTFGPGWIDAHLAAMRERFGQRQIMNRDVGRTMGRRQTAPDILCFAADLKPVETASAGTTATFLGQPISLYNTLPRIASRFGMHIVFARLKRLGYGRFRVTLEDLSPPPEPGTAGAVEKAYFAALEKSVLEDPASWLFWRWVGWWKR